MDKAYAVMTSNTYAVWCERNYWTDTGGNWVVAWVDGMTQKLYNFKCTTSPHGFQDHTG